MFAVRGQKLDQALPSEPQQEEWQELMPKKFHLNVRNDFFLCSDQALDCHRGCGVSLTGNVQKQPWATCSGGPAGAGGWTSLPSNLPQFVIPWFNIPRSCQLCHRDTEGKGNQIPLCGENESSPEIK